MYVSWNFEYINADFILNILIKLIFLHKRTDILCILFLPFYRNDYMGNSNNHKLTD